MYVIISHAVLPHLPSLAGRGLEVEGPVFHDLLRAGSALCSVGARRVPLRDIAVLLEYTYDDDARDAGERSHASGVLPLHTCHI